MKNIIEIKYTQVLIIDWMVRVDWEEFGEIVAPLAKNSHVRKRG